MREQSWCHGEVDLLAKMATWLPVPDYDPICPEDIAVCGSLFNVVHGWFVASFGRQEAAIGKLGICPEDIAVCGSLFNVVHGWFVASFGRQEAAIGKLGESKFGKFIIKVARRANTPPGGALSAVRAQCNYLGVWPY